MATLEHIIIRSLITEKVSLATEHGNVYGFQVVPRANKNQVKQAVEKLYDVKVLKVNTMVNPGKLRKRKMKVSKTPKWKKAFVQIEQGQKIEIFKNV